MPGFIVGNMRTNEGANPKANFVMQYTWEIPNIFGMKKIDIQNENSRNAFIMLKECGTPTFVANQEKHVSSNLEYKFAQSVTWDDIRLTWYDTDGLIELIREWRKTVWTSSEGLQPASSYKKNTQLTCYNQSGTSRFGWVLRNSWPSTIKNGELTYAGSEAKIVEVTVTYDWADECYGKKEKIPECADFIA